MDGGSSVRRPGSEDPHRRERKFHSCVCILVLTTHFKLCDQNTRQKLLGVLSTTSKLILFSLVVILYVLVKLLFIRPIFYLIQILLRLKCCAPINCLWSGMSLGPEFFKRLLYNLYFTLKLKEIQLPRFLLKLPQPILEVSTFEEEIIKDYQKIQNY